MWNLHGTTDITDESTMKSHANQKRSFNIYFSFLVFISKLYHCYTLCIELICLSCFFRGLKLAVKKLYQRQFHYNIRKKTTKFREMINITVSYRVSYCYYYICVYQCYKLVVATETPRVIFCYRKMCVYELIGRLNNKQKNKIREKLNQTSIL